MEQRSRDSQPAPEPAQLPQLLRPPPPTRLELDSDADDWSSLLAAELSDPNPPHAGQVVAEPEAVQERARLVSAAAPPAQPAAASPSDRPSDAPPATSEIEKAVRNAAETRPLPPAPAALWLEAAEELRERRTYPPSDEPSELPAQTPDVRPSTPSQGGPSVLEEERTGPVTQRPLSAKRRRRKLSRPRAEAHELKPDSGRPTKRLWVVALLFSLLGGAAVIAALRKQGTSASGATSASEVMSVAVPISAPSPAAAASSAAVVPTLLATLSASAPPPPVIARPKEMGLLWVDTRAEVDVYVQGFPVGKSRRYLEVQCGLKNVRVARPDPPPAGHSFPLWLGRAETVLVPCGGLNRIRMDQE